MADTENNAPPPSRAPLPKRTTYDDTAPSLAGVASDDKAILKAMHEAFDEALDAWDPIRAEGDEDMRFVSGDPWTATDRTARKNRPVVHVDQIGQYVHQLVNSVRQNKRAIKVTPEGDGANDETAQYRAGRIRQIEYLSHAQEAYTTAFENAANRSYGFGRLEADYESPRTQNRALRIVPIPDPNRVLPGAEWQRTSLADVKKLWFTKTVTQDEFARDFPTATVTDFGLDMQTMAPRWIQTSRVQIAEYWQVRDVRRTVYEIQPPTPIKDRLMAVLSRQPIQKPPTVVYIEGVDEERPKGETVDSWERDVPEVCMYLTNGIELLAKAGKPKKQVWKGSYIPFFACFGKILYRQDGKREIVSYVRPARDPQKALDWIESTKLEVMAMQPRTPYFAYEGSLSAANLALINRSVHEPVPVIFGKPKTDATGDALLPLPRRELPDMSAIAGYELAAESEKRNIQNALGAYNASVGKNDSSVKSGVQQQQLDRQADQGSFHFIDHYDDMIRHVGVMLDELLPYYDDTAKDVTLRKPDDSVETKRINDPTHVNPDTQQKEFFNATVGRHLITISTGPSFDSERQAANDLATTLLGNPAAFPVIAADAVRLMNVGPLGDQMAEDLEVLQPPALQQKKAAAKGPQDPKLLQMQIQQLQQQMQAAHGVIEAAQRERQSKQIEQEGKMAVVQVQEQHEDARAALDRETKITVAQLAALAKELADTRAFFLEERARLGAQAHEIGTQAADHAHEAATQAMDHQQASDMADKQAATAAQSQQVDIAARQAQDTGQQG